MLTFLPDRMLASQKHSGKTMAPQNVPQVAGQQSMNQQPLNNVSTGTDFSRVRAFETSVNKIQPRLNAGFPVLQRQCSCGKAGSGKEDDDRLLKETAAGKVLQPKLNISQPGDPFEVEADRVAQQVLRMPFSGMGGIPGRGVEAPVIALSLRHGSHRQLSRQANEEEGTDEADTTEEHFSPENLLSAKERSGSIHGPSAGVTRQILSMRGGGQPLAPEVRAFFEPLFQRDFSQVRVHNDTRAAQTTQAINAKAYTLGSDIAFSPGEYNPHSAPGRMLLAHELTHTVQQSNHVQTLMRACDCKTMGTTDPPQSVHDNLSPAFPNLKKSDYCITGAATPTYNCYAWSMGITSKWLDKEVDTVHGDNNGTLEYSDFDKMYASQGLKPVTGSTPSNASVALYGKGNHPTHAARNTGIGCGNFESKLGKAWRIVHYPNQLEGGSVYGDINRYYVPLLSKP